MKKTRLRITRLNVKGFTLIASLLMLLLMSGMAIGLLMMVNTEGKVGGSDLQNNVAYHAAEGGIEKMYSDLSAVFKSAQAPTATQICAASATANQPSMPGITWTQYSIMPGSAQSASCPTTLSTTWGQIGTGPNQGLYAQIIPVNMLATAALTGGQEVTMIRQSQVALIPVFQYGMFCEDDCSIFPGGGMTFAGPIHTNGDFYPFVGGGANLTFQAKVSAFGNIVRAQLPNTNSSSGETGTVYVPTANSPTACSNSSPSAAPATGSSNNCTSLAAVGTTSPWGDGSVQGGGSPTAQATGTYSGVWNNYSNNTLNDMVINGNYGSKTVKGTGAKRLSMPFVSGNVLPYEVIRRPPTTEAATSLTGQSREYNMAQIHVLLSDDPADLPGGASDANNIRLANITTTQATATGSTATNPYGITMTAGNYASTFSAGNYQLYFAAASNAVPSAGTVLPATTAPLAGLDTPDWPYAPAPWLGNVNNASPTLQGLQPTGPAGGPGAPILLGSNASIAPTLAICPPASPLPQNSIAPTGCPAVGTAPASPYYAVNGVAAVNNSSAVSAQTATWSLIDGYLRVEYLNNSGAWVGVTQEWLNLGFARGVTAPTANSAGLPSTGTKNPINPNAILLFQEPAERNTPSSYTALGGLPSYAQLTTGIPSTCITTTGTGAAQRCTEWTAVPPLLVDTGATYWQFGTSTTSSSVSQFNWYPINFYDVREGEPRDIDWSISTLYGSGDNSCTANGVMNAVELDVGNLQQWLLNSTSGQAVNSSSQNGYILYFSDRRGMLLNPNVTSSHPANSKSGDSGLEDTVNLASTPGVTDGSAETPMTGRTLSPEDENENGVLDNWGAYNLGLGFYGTVSNATQNLNAKINANPTTTAPNPYGALASGAGSNRIASCGTTGRKNWVSGARHVLKLVDGSLGNLPLNPNPIVSNGVTYHGGFTVAAENPVYIQGDYNSNPTDTVWNSPSTDSTGMAAAAVLADTVILLSDSWDDRISMLGTTGNTSPSHYSNKPASNTYYRLAIASGKNMTFTYPSVWAPKNDVGTDGGIHNFLHLLESWSGVTTNYTGSMASLYYSTYNTGFYKCCVAVYINGTRNFSFDADFKNPAGLPPGTPMFRDVESLGYRQVYTTRLTGQ